MGAALPKDWLCPYEFVPGATFGQGKLIHSTNCKGLKSDGYVFVIESQFFDDFELPIMINREFFITVESSEPFQISAKDISKSELYQDKLKQIAMIYDEVYFKKLRSPYDISGEDRANG